MRISDWSSDVCSSDLLFPGFLDKKWGRPFLQDAFATKLYSPIMPDYPFAVIELCQCFPDDLHIADVELSDIRRKLEQPQNGIGARGYHGLGVFGALRDGVKMVDKEGGLSGIRSEKRGEGKGGGGKGRGRWGREN